MEGVRRALIVANDVYDHDDLAHLRSPSADAAALADVLGDRQVSDFDVQVVQNETAHVVQGHIEDLFADGASDDVLLLHFSCHGIKNEAGDLFFAARNTRPNRLGSTAVPADFVQRCMRSSRSRSIVLLLDCCFGGAFGQGVAVRATGDVNVLDSFPRGGSAGRGRAVITASSSMEYAFEGDHLADSRDSRPSVFTQALVEGLRTGEADRDEDGWIALGELYDYIFERVRISNPNQTPTCDMEKQGELYLARSRKRRIKAAPIPPDLIAATTDTNMFTRLGAVTELRSRLGNDDVAVALGAHEALRTIARVDISTVAEAATLALREVALNVIESEIRFGRVPLGSPQRRVIPLPDHPLVRAGTIDTEQQWIVATWAPGGLAVEVDTATPGDRHGEVAIKGPTGEAAIAVRVEVFSENAPPPPQPIPPPEDAPVPETSVPSGRARVVTAGPFAIAAAVLLVLSLMSYYADDVQLVRFRPFAATYVVGMVIVAVVAGAMTLATTVRRPVAAGAVLGAVAASVWGWVFLAVDSVESGLTAAGIGIGPSLAEEAQTTLSAGFWLLGGGHLALAVAGVCVLASREWRAVSRREGFRPVTLAAALGLPGAAMMFVEANSLNGVSGMIYPSMWWLSLTAGLMALVVAGSVFLVRSNGFSIGLVAGWAGGGLAIAASDYQFVADTQAVGLGFVVTFGLILLIQLVIAVYSGRQTRLS